MQYKVFKEKPKIICLCGSTRFHEEFYRQRLLLELQGYIVLTITCDRRDDDSLFMIFQSDVLKSAKDIVLQRFVELHMRKIELADEILVINVNGYIDTHTQNEIEYATLLDKPISYLEDSELLNDTQRRFEDIVDVNTDVDQDNFNTLDSTGRIEEERDVIDHNDDVIEEIKDPVYTEVFVYNGCLGIRSSILSEGLVNDPSAEGEVGFVVSADKVRISQEAIDWIKQIPESNVDVGGISVLRSGDGDVFCWLGGPQMLFRNPGMIRRTHEFYPELLTCVVDTEADDEFKRAVDGR